MRVYGRFLIKCFKRGKVRPDQTVKKGRGVLSIGNSAPPWSPLRRRNEVFVSVGKKKKKSRTQQAPWRTAAFTNIPLDFYTQDLYINGTTSKDFQKTKTAFYNKQTHGPAVSTPSETEIFPLRQIDFQSTDLFASVI